jgi:hypothetical protein
MYDGIVFLGDATSDDWRDITPPVKSGDNLKDVAASGPFDCRYWKNLVVLHK